MEEYLKKFRNRRVSFCDSYIYREFSVLVPIVRRDQGYSLLFEIRSEKLSKQPSEICFPGGKIENSENSSKAAIRETSEELLIPESAIVVAGELDTLVTPFNSVIYPFVGVLQDYRDTFNPREVKEIFYVPLSYLMETEPLCKFIGIEMKPGEDFPYDMIQSGRNYPWTKGRYPIYFYTYEDKIIWGITARIMHNFIELLKKNQP